VITTNLTNSIVENEKAVARNGIGLIGRIENTSSQKARIGNNVVISPAAKPENVDHPTTTSVRHSHRPQNGIIPHGMVI